MLGCGHGADRRRAAARGTVGANRGLRDRKRVVRSFAAPAGGCGGVECARAPVLLRLEGQARDEVYGLALQTPERFPGFLQRAVGVWLDFLEPSALRDGYSNSDARAIATMILAGYRGFLLDLCATGERRRLDRAVDLWIDALDTIPPPKGVPRAKRR